MFSPVPDRVGGGSSEMPDGCAGSDEVSTAYPVQIGPPQTATSSAEEMLSVVPGAWPPCGSPESSDACR